MEQGRYPVRDPFFKMLPRSLQNFMNAFTSSDYTMYPFATTNAQDFKNLMGVYLDATLHPLLKRADFVQEGWRVGPANPLEAQDAKDLVFKGVVYNEMKGQMSDATYLFYIRFMEHIFPSLNNSGGDPAKMTELTYEQLRDFHRGHYHPSNSKIITYGDQSVEDHLLLLGETLDNFSETNSDGSVKLPLDLSDGARHVTLPGPIDPLTSPNAQFKTSRTWLMGDTTNIAESFALQIATSLLMDGYGSPLYRALIESGLGTDFTPNTGYDSSARVGIFSVGLNGVVEENVPKVHEAITTALNEVITNGFEKQKVDGLLHQLELGLKHKTATFGMNLVQRLKPGWFNGIDPFAALAWNSIVEQFKSQYAQGGYLEKLLAQYVLSDNTMTFTMAPSISYGTDLAAEEAQRLKKKIWETVSQFETEEEAHEQLRKRELDLLEEQESGQSESLESLPTLHVSDIPRTQKKAELRFGDIHTGTRVQWRETATNGITYFRALSLFKDLPDELRMLVPLFCDSLMRIGTRDKSMEQLEDLIKLRTGGISFGYHASTSPTNTLRAEEGLMVTGHALDGNVAEMYQLIQAILLETDFDGPNAKKMVRQLLQTNASGAVDAIASSGHGYARNFAAAGLTPRGKLIEQTAGLTQVQLITSLAAAEESEEAMSELLGKLKTIQTLAVSNLNRTSRVALTCGTDVASANETNLNKFLEKTANANLSKHLSVSQSLAPDGLQYPAGVQTFFNFPYQVYYSALALPTGPYTEPSTASFAILSQLLTHRHLHHEIREKGGAYGGGAFSAGNNGFFGMYSYRDPNPENTLRVMRDAGRWALEREWTDRELEEAKLGVFQSVDAPRSVSDEGASMFLNGIDEDMEQRRREWLLDVDKSQVREAAEKLNRNIGSASITLLGAKKGFVSMENGWVVKDMGMVAAEEVDKETRAEAAAAI